MKYKDPLTGEYKELFLKASDTLPIGAIVPYGSDDIPTNWLLCDGSEVSRTTYASLFSAIGTNFGEGDGETTFNLPDFRSRIPLGKDVSDEDFDTLGKTYGEKEHTLTIDEMPKHKHRIDNYRGSGSQNWGGLTGVANVDGVVQGTPTTTETGGGLPHNIVQPSLVTNYIIKAGMSVGVMGSVVNEKTDSSKDTYSCDYIENLVKKSVITAWSSETIKVYESSSNNMLNLDTKESIGDALSLEDSGIRIGKNVNYVLVSAQLTLFWDSPKSNDINLYVLINDKNELRANSNKSVDNLPASICIASTLLKVKEGDFIRLGMHTGVANSKVYTQLRSTFLNVEVVE